MDLEFRELLSSVGYVSHLRDCVEPAILQAPERWECPYFGLTVSGLARLVRTLRLDILLSGEGPRDVQIPTGQLQAKPEAANYYLDWQTLDFVIFAKVVGAGDGGARGKHSWSPLYVRLPLAATCR